MSATCGRFGASASNPRSTRSGLPPVPFAGLAVTGVLPRRTPRIPDSRVTFITWSRPISAGSQPRADDRACVLRYPYTAMKKSEWTRRMSRAGASRLAAMQLTGLDLNMRQPRGVTSPVVQRSGQHPADRPGPGTVLEFVDVSGHQRRVGSSRAAKKADAVVNVSFARLDCATSARKLFNSAIASSAGCLVSGAPVASALLRQRRSVSGATPDPWRPVRSPWSPTNTSRATRSTA